MTDTKNLITDNIDVWTSALQRKSGVGRGSSKKLNLYGIKKLRKLILELAVRGKLVPQDPSDEPASELLKKVKPEKERIAKEGKFKDFIEDSAINKSNHFKLPPSWTWCQLGEISAIARGGSPRPIKSFITEADDGINWIKIGDSKRGSRYITSTEQKIKPEGISRSRQVYKGDLILSNSMSFGYPYIMNITGCIHDGWLVIRLPETLISKLYLCNLFLAPYVKNAFAHASSGAVVQNLNADKVKALNIPLPPLPEQKRIVAKVDELMALCDQLESQTESSITAHETLVETLLSTLTNSKNSEELSENWARIALHFEILFTTESSIDKLKQTVLQLAVMGKLVPQDDNDEPASVLLEKIAKEKERLVKEGKIKKQKVLPGITEGEKSFELPKGWEWCRLEDIVDIRSGITKGRKLAGRQLVSIPYLRVANVQRGYLDLLHIKEIEIPKDEVEKYSVLERDLLITEGGDWDKVGRTAIWNSEMLYIGHQNHVFKARIILYEQNEKWLEKYLNSQYARDYFAGSSKQTTNLASINKTQLRGCIVANPPLLEQQRIVTKFNELVELCDQLKGKLINTQATQLNLADGFIRSTIK